jgi:hypothetical protein
MLPILGKVLWLAAIVLVMWWIFRQVRKHRDLLSNAGFTEVATHHVPGKNWILAIGRRPS